MATTPTATARFLQRLPQFITLFFSITLVNGFRIFADTFHWSTQPTFDFRDPSQLMVAASFILTLFWVVTAWLGYSLLIERYPYTLHFSRFFFDVARFVIMFALINFSFLAGKAESYHIFVFTLAISHLLMTGWHIEQIRNAEGIEQRRERQSDARGHALRFFTYLLLGLLYYFGVAVRSGEGFSEAVHYGIVVMTLVAMTVWNVKRLSELKEYALKEMTGTTDAATSSSSRPLVTSPGVVPSDHR